MPRWREWFGGRSTDPRAAAYVAVLCEDPSSDDVDWLAAYATQGDTDHARWELRYARRAVGLLAAQRDALDDQTASLVASELTRVVHRDPQVAANKRSVAEQQFTARLRAYGDASLNRESGESASARLGRVLLGFAGHRAQASAALIEQAGEVIARYRAEANGALRAHFGVAALPEDVAPSALRPGLR